MAKPPGLDVTPTAVTSTGGPADGSLFSAGRRRGGRRLGDAQSQFSVHTLWQDVHTAHLSDAPHGAAPRRDALSRLLQGFLAKGSHADSPADSAPSHVTSIIGEYDGSRVSPSGQTIFRPVNIPWCVLVGLVLSDF